MNNRSNHVFGYPIALAWFYAVLVAAGTTFVVLMRVHRRRTQTTSSLVLDSARHKRRDLGDSPTSTPTRIFTAIGRAALRLIRRPGSDRAELFGKAIVFLGVSSLLHPLLGMVVGASVIARERRIQRQRADERVRLIRAELSALLDLLRVSVSAGLTIRQAIDVTCRTAPFSADEQTGREPDGELAVLLRAAVDDVGRGVRFVESIAAIPDLPVIGSELRLLVSTLLATERYGTPPGPGLAQLANDVRDVRRRAAEADARRVPIRMLGPLILLLLPSFILLTIVPLLIGGLSSLGIAS